MLSRLLGLLRRPLPVSPRPYDPDGDGEGTWIEHPPFYGRVSYTWRPPVIEDPSERCPSQECLFGREWIPCKKRVGHKGIHRNCESWAWEEGDERVVEVRPTSTSVEIQSS